MNRLGLDRAREILDKVRQVRILVVGDLMLDRYLIGTVDRISPEAPVPVVRMEKESWALGGAGNVAANVMALGAGCEMVGCVGEDADGKLVRELLEGMGAGTRGVVSVQDRPTTVKTRIMARHQHVTRVDREERHDISGEVGTILARAVRKAAPGVQGIALEDYNKGVLVPDLVEAALEEGRRGRVPSVVDPKRLRFFEFQGATLFKPNARELEEALGEEARPESHSWMTRVRRRVGCANLLLTLGEEGMALEGETVGYLRIPTVAREVFDVSGAGDTVTAVVSVALAAGASPAEGAILANQAAAVEVGKAGVATVFPEEILDQHQAYLKEAGP